MNFPSVFKRLSLLTSLLKPSQSVFRTVSYAALGLPLALTACASSAPTSTPVNAIASPDTAWHAPLPHGGQITHLQRWWSQFNDPLLLRLIEDAQHASPTLARATANIADARAARVSSDAALWPSLDLNASAARGRSDISAPVSMTSSVGVQASWELDVFGAGRAGSRLAQARLASIEAGWHDARVSVAAEVARNYVEFRACEARAHQAEMDAVSRSQTAALTDQAADAGMRSPASADLARASAAQGRAIWIQQQVQCDLLVKALVALGAQAEPALRRELAQAAAQLPRPQEFSVGTVPAEVLAQRPDIHAAALDVLAAGASSDQAVAQRWPRITLAGSIGNTRVNSIGVSTDGTVWSVGPIAITFPLFDGGTRQANAQAAHVRHETAKKVYAAHLRTAIQEVESALVTLGSAAQRSESAKVAAEGFDRSFRATAASYQAGLASLFELEDARRSTVSAQSALIDLHRERVLAWIALYRAIGGGWSASSESRN